MTRDAVVKLALSLGYKEWGQLRAYGKGNDSQYQCFRRGNDYAWVGNFYVEVSTNPVACDFLNGERNSICDFLTGVGAND